MTNVQQGEDILKAAKASMYANDFASALTQLKSLTEPDAANPEALYMSAVCARYLQDYPTAHAHLDALIAMSPEFGRAYQEAGHLALAQNKTALALSCYQYACRFNPALLASWERQAELLAQMGRSKDAASARAQADRLKSLPKPLVSVTNLLAEGKLLKAEDLCRKFLRAQPKHVEGMRLLADIGARLGVLEDADILLENAVNLEPDNVQLRLDYIQVLRKAAEIRKSARRSQSAL